MNVKQQVIYRLYELFEARSSSKSLVPKVGCTAPWGAVGLPRGALEVGPSERVVRLFTTDQARA
jgi:hypothetical protein